MAGWLLLLYAGGAQGCSLHTAYAPPASGISAALRTVYPLAWEAPGDADSPYCVDLDPAAQLHGTLKKKKTPNPKPVGLSTALSLLTTDLFPILVSKHREHCQNPEPGNPLPGYIPFSRRNPPGHNVSHQGGLQKRPGGTYVLGVNF